MLDSSATPSADRDPVRARVHETLARFAGSETLPALPAAATAALRVARDPDVDGAALCDVIRSDVGLAARIVRVANSVLFGRLRPAKTLEEAVLTIGLRETCNVLVAASVRRVWDLPGQRARPLWRHALGTAIAAEALAATTRRADPSIAFLPGLFHDVGLIAFFLADPTGFATVQMLADAGEGETWQVERDWYEFDHAEAGRIMTESWGVAPEQAEAVGRHHDWTRATGPARELAALVSGADALAHSLGFGTGLRPPAVACAPLDLSPADEARVAERVRTVLARYSELLA
jgi:HD-like signal output (HDOD) protein